MKYRRFGKTDEQVSILGFGTMRLPLKNGQQGSSSYGEEQVDWQTSIDCIRYAVDHGVNYLDTAYNYLGGVSERVVGAALRDGYRDRVLLASKSPTWLLRGTDDFDRIFREQLQRLQTDRIDMYLLHGLNEQLYRNIVRPYGVIKALRQAKESGRVRYIGFSFHDELPLFREILDAADWDFCQIQLNYVDTAHQAGLAGLRDAAARGMAVSVMEPLRGGYLVQPPEDVCRSIRALGRTPVEFALNFVWNLPEVSTVLSGMGSIAQIAENLAYAAHAEAGMLSDAELQTAADAKARIYAQNQIGCTGCRYCEPGCPQKIPISSVFRCFNRYTNANDDQAKDAYRALKAGFGANARDCVHCGQCEGICPQHIRILEWLEKTDVLLR